MKKISAYQLIVIGACILLAVVGVLIFALLGGALGNSSSVGAVTIWGTEDSQVMQSILANIRQTDKSFLQVQYVQKNADTYESDLINAIASGNAPDLLFMPQ